MINQIRYLLLILLALTSFESYADAMEILREESKRISLTEEEVLEVFFKNLLSSGAGFVLYGDKPLSLKNFNDEEGYLPGTELHRNSTIIREGLSLWEKLVDEKNQNAFILHRSHNPKKKASFENEILFINRKAFLEVVKQNLILFQYKLGTNITAEALLNKLMAFEDDITSIFKGNQALLGIVLGYGTTNSLSYERGTHLASLSRKLIIPPYQSHLPLTADEVKQSLLSANLEPGFGYLTIRQEVEELSDSMTPSPKDSTRAVAQLAFSYHKDTEETHHLLKKLDETRLKIDNILESDHFLEEIFTKFDTKITLTKKSLPYIDSKWIPLLSDLVARHIWLHFLQILPEDSLHYVNEFILGMRDAEKNEGDRNTENDEAFIFLPFFTSQLAANPNMKRNWTTSRDFFDAFSQKPYIQCVEPLKIYYNVLKEGLGPSFPHIPKEIRANYLIKNIEGKVLKGTYALSSAESLDLSTVISGLPHGLVGMKKNEVREVFIHPDFAYGLNAQLGEGLPLIIQIELVDWKDDLMDLPELIPFDFMHLSQQKIQSKSHLVDLKKQYVFLCGYTLRKHYRFFNLEEILTKIFQLKNTPQILLNQEERDVLRKLDWLIYIQAHL